MYDGAVGAISVSAVCGFHELVKGSARIDVIMVRSDKGEEGATCPSNRTFDLRIFCVDTVHSTYLIDGQFSQHLISALNHCGSEHGRLTWHPIIHPDDFPGYSDAKPFSAPRAARNPHRN